MEEEHHSKGGSIIFGLICGIVGFSLASGGLFVLMGGGKFSIIGWIFALFGYWAIQSGLPVAASIVIGLSLIGLCVYLIKKEG